MKTTLSSALLLGVLPLLGPPPADVEWPAYANDAGGSHYSTAAQIDRQTHGEVAFLKRRQRGQQARFIQPARLCGRRSQRRRGR